MMLMLLPRQYASYYYADIDAITYAMMLFRFIFFFIFR